MFLEDDLVFVAMGQLFVRENDGIEHHLLRIDANSLTCSKIGIGTTSCTCNSSAEVINPLYMLYSINMHLQLEVTHSKLRVQSLYLKILHTPVM